MGRTIFVGDVHGCIDELKDLLMACGQHDDDQVILVGDLVAKGPDSQAVVQFARESRFAAVLGNHDDHVLQLRDRAPKSAKRAEHAQVAQSLSVADVAWLQALPLYLELPHSELPVVAVHGGLLPGVPLAEQPRKYLLNLRSLREDGTPSRKIEPRPWGEVWHGPPHAVFGHDAMRGLQLYDHATGLDTGCVYGQRLTGLIWPQRQLVSVPARRNYAPLSDA